MDSDQLFLERCKQIERACASNSEVELLDLSGWLTQAGVSLLENVAGNGYFG